MNDTSFLARSDHALVRLSSHLVWLTITLAVLSLYVWILIGFVFAFSYMISGDTAFSARSAFVGLVLVVVLVYLSRGLLLFWDEFKPTIPFWRKRSRP